MVEREQFHPHDRWDRQACPCDITDFHVQRPARIHARSDHRQDGMTDAVPERTGVGEDQRRSPFGCAAVGEGERNDDDVECLKVHDKRLRLLESPIRSRCPAALRRT